MAIPTTRQGLKEYCLRELGAPVLEINIDDDQLEDRIDQSLDFWRLYHYDGIEKLYMKQQIRASEITLVESIADTFPLSATITGQTSGATAICRSEVSRISQGTLLLVSDVVGTFESGETITTDIGVTATLDSITLREYDNRFIPIDDWVYGITRVIPFAQASSSKNLFDLQYQLRLNDLYDLTSTSIVYFKTVMSHLALLDLTLNGMPQYRFNRMQGKLFLDINWHTFPLGQYIVVEAYRALNPADFNKIWNENWLKRYTTSQFKRQWGTNMKKFGGIQLPGGVTLNGDTIYQEAINEIKDLEDELLHKSAPLDFFMG